MRWLVVVLLAIFCGQLSGQEPVVDKSSVRFRTVDIHIDAQGQPLAAYQLEFLAPSGAAKIVGIEGGEHPSFAEPPFYDPKALQHERIILAAFNTSPAANLPTRQTRIATLHLQIAGNQLPRCTLKVQTAGTVGGKKIKVIATFEERKTK